MPTRDTIVIGASAGGVQALITLVAGLPTDLPAAVFIVLQHLLIENRCVRLVRGPKENLLHPSIEALFRSAARWAGPRVIGVILIRRLLLGSENGDIGEPALQTSND